MNSFDDFNVYFDKYYSNFELNTAHEYKRDCVCHLYIESIK